MNMFTQPLNSGPVYLFGPTSFRIVWPRKSEIANSQILGGYQRMISRQRRALIMGVLITTAFASFGWLAAQRPVMRPTRIVATSEEQRLHDMALRDLKETQDEIAKMKAHGIGMHPATNP